MLKKNSLCKRLATALLCASFLPLLNVAHSLETAEPIKVAVICENYELYVKAIGVLSRKDFLTVIERRDLKPVLRELKLKQTGVVEDLPQKQVAGVEFLIQMDSQGDRVMCHMIQVFEGKIMGGWSGSVDSAINDAADRLEAQAALKALAALKTTEKGIGVKINFREYKYRLGQELQCFVRADEDGYLYLIDVQPGGDIVVLVPNQAARVFRIKANTTVEVPGDMGFSLTVIKPVGTDRLKAIVTKRPIDITRIDGLSFGNGVGEVVKGKKGAFTRGVAVTVRKLNNDEWGEASEEIEVVE